MSDSEMLQTQNASRANLALSKPVFGPYTYTQELQELTNYLTISVEDPGTISAFADYDGHCRYCPYTQRDNHNHPDGNRRRASLTHTGPTLNASRCPGAHADLVIPP